MPNAKRTMGNKCYKNSEEEVTSSKIFRFMIMNCE